MEVCVSWEPLGGGGSGSGGSSSFGVCVERNEGAKGGKDIHFREGKVDCGGEKGWSNSYTDCISISHFSQHCPVDPVRTNLHQEPSE